MPADDKPEPVEFGTEDQQTAFGVQKDDVSGQDILKLAKSILLYCALIFIAVATLRATVSNNPGISDVWEFSKIILPSITSLILGLYFGKKEK